MIPAVNVVGLSTEAEMLKVERRFPGWRLMAKTEEFVEWFYDNPQFHHLAHSPLAEDAISLLEEYRVSKWREGRHVTPDKPKPARISSARDKRLLLL